MGRVLLICCTNVGSVLINEIVLNSQIKSKLVGVVNLNGLQGLNKANYSSYATIVRDTAIDIHYCDNVNDDLTHQWILNKKPDVIIQSGWSQKFQSRLLSIPKYGCIGEHPAPLPKGRGAACVNWAIINGETEWGDTFFQMTNEFDKGNIYSQRFFKIEKYDNVRTVYDKIALSSKDIIRQNIDKWSEGSFNPIAQDESKATYYKRRKPEDGLFTFNLNSEQAHNYIRAQTHPYPGAFILFNKKKVKIYSSILTDLIKVDSFPGQVISTNSDGSISVACSDKKAINILRVQPESYPEMWASDWAKMDNVKIII